MQDDINISLRFPAGRERKHEIGRRVVLQRVIPDYSDLVV